LGKHISFYQRSALLSFLSSVLLASLAPAQAVQPDEQLADPALEARARAISSELRCLVCQNQSIDDSDAPLARDLRLLVRERLKAGDSDGAVQDFIVARYGEFVLLRPPFEPATLILWLTPVVLLMAAGLFAWRHLARGRERAAPAAPLSEDEEAKLARALAEAKRHDGSSP
jgi:cytochrome c-type biogenesis protein CcmH